MEALKYLADRAGLSMPDPRSPKEKNEMAKLHEKKQRMYKMNVEAAKFFHSCLVDPKYKYALDYFLSRKIKPSTISSFGLGYAPNSWDALLNHLKGLGFKEREIEECGLCIKRENDNSYFDKFRNRVMFPIIDLRGNVIGFGGRIIDKRDEKSAKYLNSPETLVFKKKENLFAMNFAKNTKEDKLLLMEGYMDVISLHQNGITNAVASLGTAFTPEQAQIIKRYKGKAVLCYDADEAGQKATKRAGEILMSAGVKTKVLTVTDGKDPDEYINAKGPEMFLNLVENAKNLIEYRIGAVEKQYNLDDSSEKTEFIEKAAAIFAELKDPVEREIYIKSFSRKYDISLSAVEAHLQNLVRKESAVLKRQNEAKEKRDFEKRTGGRKSLDSMRLYNAEQLLLNLLCEKDVFLMVSKDLSENDFSEGLHRKIAEKIYNIHKSGEKVNSAALISEFAPEEVPEAAKILLDDKNVDNKKEAAVQPLEIIKNIKNKKMEDELLENGDIESLKKIMEQLKIDKR